MQEEVDFLAEAVIRPHAAKVPFGKNRQARFRQVSALAAESTRGSGRFEFQPHESGRRAGRRSSAGRWGSR